MDYTLIERDEDIARLVADWKKDGVAVVAMDFEGEFNLHCYGEHLCLIQIFDGKNFYLVDTVRADQAASRRSATALGKPFAPFAKDDGSPFVTEDGLRLLLETPDVEKLWFDCASDGELVWKKFGIRLAAVYDVFRVAKVLGLVGPGLAGNLAALTERFVTGTEGCGGDSEVSGGLEGCGDGFRKNGLSKKRLQQTNWTRRPLSAPQLEYALQDVANLFALRRALDELAASQKLQAQVRSAMEGLPHIREETVPGHTKMPGYKRLTAAQKIYLRRFFEARDTVARQLNKPPFQVLDKHLLVKLAQKAPLLSAQLQAELGVKSRSGSNNTTRPAQLLLPLMEEAQAAAQRDLGGSG